MQEPETGRRPSRSAGSPGDRPPLQPTRRIAAALLALAIMLATITLLGSTWLRATVFTADWYRPILSDPAFLDGVRQAAETEINAQAARFGLPESVLTHGLDNAQISQYLNRYLDRFVDFLNYRAAFEAPELGADLLSTPIVAYARDLAGRIGLTLTPEQEQRLREVAVEIARFMQDRLNLMTRTEFLSTPEFQRYHSLAFTFSQLALPAAIVLGFALLLLFLVLFGHFRRFLWHAAIAIWLAGAAAFAAVAGARSGGLPESLSIEPGYLREAAVSLANAALDSLMQRSVLILAVATLLMVVLLLMRPRRSRGWAAGI